MTEDQYTDDTTDASKPEQRIAELEDRIEQLEATIKKMLPGRRDALKLGGAAALGAAAFSGTASAGSSQVGTIGDASNLVDVQAEDIEVSDTITTQDLVVNGNATGPFAAGGILLASGDSITVESIDRDLTDASFVTLYNGSAKDVLGGVIGGGDEVDFLYTFDDGTTLKKNGSGTSYSGGNRSRTADRDGTPIEIVFLPPAENVTKIEVGSKLFGNSELGAEVLLKD